MKGKMNEIPSKFHVIHNDNFNLDVNAFDTKEGAFRFIEETMRKDKYAAKDKFVVIEGDRIFLDVKEETHVTVFEAED